MKNTNKHTQQVDQMIQKPFEENNNAETTARLEKQIDAFRSDLRGHPYVQKQKHRMKDTNPLQDQKMPSDTPHPIPVSDKLTVWRIIMKNRLIRTVAIVLIIMGSLFGFNFLGRQIGGPSLALADMTVAMKKQPWLHGIVEGTFDGKLNRIEAWFSFDAQISATVEQSGEIVFSDHKKCRRQAYSPETDTITLSYVPKNETLEKAGSPLGFWQVVTEQLQGMDYTKHVSLEGSIEMQSYRMETSPFGGPMEVTITIDRNLSLPIALTQKIFNQDNTLKIEANGSFDYPDKGPDNIYAIGAPRSAKRIDRMPCDEIPPVIALHETHRKASPSHYIAVVFDYWIYKGSPVSEQASIIYRNGKKQRVEHYAIPQKNRNEFRLNRQQYKNEMGDTFDRLYSWWTQDKMSQLGSVDLFDGKYQHQVRMEGEKYKRLPKFTTFGNDYRGDDDLADFGWRIGLLDESEATRPEQGPLGIVINEYSKKGNLVCLEKKSQGKIIADDTGRLWAIPPKRIAYYINPDRDYICQRFEQEEAFDAAWQIDKAWLENEKDQNLKKQSPYSRTTEVLEYGQTVDGEWYPKKMKKWCPSNPNEGVQIRQIFLAVDPEFPERIFNAATLPK